MNLIEFLKVNKYFKGKVRKVKAKNAYVAFPNTASFVRWPLKFLPFHFQISFVKKQINYKNFVKHSTNVCKEHSYNLLLGLNKSDLCVAGVCNYHENANNYHVWNEFEFGGKWYVYDCQNDSIFDRQRYYDFVEPEIIMTETLSNVLEEFGDYKTSGDEFDFIEIPRDIEPSVDKDEAYRNYAPSKNRCYRSAKIKLDKDGEVKSAIVVAPENC